MISQIDGDILGNKTA